MPRKQYRQDLLNASANASFGNIDQVMSSDEDELFTFVFRDPNTDASFTITAHIDPSEYPSSHSYRMFAAHDAPPKLAHAVEKCPDFKGVPLAEALLLISTFFGTELRFDKTAAEDASQEYEMEDDMDDVLSIASEISSLENDSLDHSATCKADLRAVRDAGFKVAVSGTVSKHNQFIVSIACRIATLNISAAALDAWALQGKTYFVLLLRYVQVYRPLSAYNFNVPFSSTDPDKTGIDMRIAVSDYYKPKNHAAAWKVFGNSAESQESKSDKDTNPEPGTLEECFISAPLSTLLNQRFLRLLQFRLQKILSWDDAQREYNVNVCQLRESSEATILSTAQDITRASGARVVHDELLSPKAKADLSLPLIAMQFTLQHFLHCTEYCLICWRKLVAEVEAIKPYVCENSLCLYQYMNLGLGPSIEHEITSQPYVVDLLVSFCYQAALNSSLHSRPEGLALSVPQPAKLLHYAYRQSPAMHTEPEIPTKNPTRPSDMSATVSFTSRELTLELDSDMCALTKGQWLVLVPKDDVASFHCYIKDMSLNSISISEPIAIYDTQELKSKNSRFKVSVFPYNANLDSLDSTFQLHTLVMLLDTLPTVLEMREWLLHRPNRSLAHWPERINPASLTVLRWIVASNRSCIMQLDPIVVNDKKIELNQSHTRDRVSGMHGFMQFRFAMGAPDKENRFQTAVFKNAANLDYPTLFAWHGSPLPNWHSIIRQGLHFEKVAHGRAYGHGVYFGKDYSTSAGYANRSASQSVSWRQSVLNIGSAVALSEIVNARQRFVSCNPYYVVHELDWIQTRFLFVKSHNYSPDAVVLKKSEILPQESDCVPVGTSGPVSLPLAAAPVAKWRKSVAASSTTSQAKNLENINNPISKGAIDALTPGSEVSSSRSLKHASDDSESVITEPEDVAWLTDADESINVHNVVNQPEIQTVQSNLPFAVKALTGLPLTPQPKFATSIASRRLQKDLAMVLETQESHFASGTIDRLGWFIDPSFIATNNNLYQWIAELHSFPLDLPLAQDLQTLKMQSVILELRFHATYPMSPPFVRVIRPRFLPFQSGGGGHVTAGGSICAELLTNSGWSAVSSIESVLLQLRMAMTSLDPYPARLDAVSRGMPSRGLQQSSDYSVHEAIDAFKRACRAHGWQIPESLDAMAFS